MTFWEWIELLLKIKESEIEGVKINILNEHLKEIHKDNDYDNSYICKYIFQFYDYKEWLYRRKPRISKKIKKDK